MTDETYQPPFTERVADVAMDAAHTGEQVVSALAGAVRRLTDTLEAAKQPGRPLDTLSRVTREAPLSALFVAFLLGAAVARRNS
jgi:hypothetical protein